MGRGGRGGYMDSPVLTVAGYPEPDACTDVLHSKDVECILEQSHVRYGDVQRGLYVAKERENLRSEEEKK